MSMIRKILRAILGFVWSTALASGLSILAMLYILDPGSCIDPGRIRSMGMLIGFTVILSWKCFAFATRMALKTGRKPKDAERPEEKEEN